MLSRKSFLVLAGIILIAGNITMANMCAKIKRVSGGEYHTLALMEDNTLWACGGTSLYNYQLGLGSEVYGVVSLQQVKGENGVGHLENIVAFDAGLLHSLAVDANGDNLPDTRYL